MQNGFGMNQYPGRTIYIADFDVKTRTVSNPVSISDPNPNPKTMTLYPCWTKDESAVVYHSDKSGRNQLYMYRLKDKSTSCVSTNPNAGCLFACGEATPK
jgi:Tol biopolymer transport system component